MRESQFGGLSGLRRTAVSRTIYCIKKGMQTLGFFFACRQVKLIIKRHCLFNQLIKQYKLAYVNFSV
jgi:hypothetical protein